MAPGNGTGQPRHRAATVGLQTPRPALVSILVAVAALFVSGVSVAPCATLRGDPLVAPLRTPALAEIDLRPADAADRSDAASRPPPGFAVRLAIPAIRLDTPVSPAGIIEDADGNPTWQTRPFVAVHFVTLTGLVSEPGSWCHRRISP